LLIIYAAKLPELVVTTDMEQDTVVVLIEGVSELIKYILPLSYPLSLSLFFLFSPPSFFCSLRATDTSRKT
jgi:hypothetical protein